MKLTLVHDDFNITTTWLQAATHRVALLSDTATIAGQISNGLRVGSYMKHELKAIPKFSRRSRRKQPKLNNRLFQAEFRARKPLHPFKLPQEN